MLTNNEHKPDLQSLEDQGQVKCPRMDQSLWRRC